MAYRKLTVDDHDYEYAIGSSYTHIRAARTDKDNKWKTVDVLHENMLGMTTEQVDRGKHKKYLEITPGDVASYILKKLGVNETKRRFSKSMLANYINEKLADLPKFDARQGWYQAKDKGEKMNELYGAYRALIQLAVDFELN